MLLDKEKTVTTQHKVLIVLRKYFIFILSIL